MTDLGFKRLTVENWRGPDPLMGLFYQIDPSGESASGMTGDD